MRLTEIRERLSRHTPLDLPKAEGITHAAVAILLREAAHGVELLMIRRAERPHDPWSGHMGFPGGRMEPTDAHPEEAAIRETQEEVGVTLGRCAVKLGRLSERQAIARFQAVPMTIFPYIFELREPVEPTLNDEVAEALWVPLTLLASPEHRREMAHERSFGRVVPCVPFGEHTIWGLSLGMIDDLLRVIAAAG
jgi:8-oxo-dGTP pyrophosphatase MutT (NUDIX family)